MEGSVRTQAVVRLDRLKQNVTLVRSRLKPETELIAVLKGDAYGHGIEGVYPALKAAGIRTYAVAVWEEGAALRKAGAETEEIMTLGDTADADLPRLLEWNLTPTITSVETAERLQVLGWRAKRALPVQIKLDTGMSRLGFPADDRCVFAIASIAAMPNLKITGIFTHLARADELDRPETEEQFRRFTDTVAMLRKAGVEIPRLHVSNSPAALLHPEVQCDAVRVGDALFGLCGTKEDPACDAGLSEVLTWETKVAMVKAVPAGTQVGYGGTFTTRRETLIATLPVGFADGFRRALSNRSFVLIHGRRAPVIGRVCMDQMMVDVTDIPGVYRGDKAELLGEGRSIAAMAAELDTCTDEIVCGITKRVPRVYTE